MTTRPVSAKMIRVTTPKNSGDACASAAGGHPARKKSSSAIMGEVVAQA